MVLSPSFLSGTMLGPGGTVDSKLDTVLVFMQPSVQGAEKNHSTIIKMQNSICDKPNEGEGQDTWLGGQDGVPLGSGDAAESGHGSETGHARKWSGGSESERVLLGEMCASPAAGEPVVGMSIVRTRGWRRENEACVWSPRCPWGP